jgi:hypothetical protein
MSLSSGSILNTPISASVSVVSNIEHDIDTNISVIYVARLPQHLGFGMSFTTMKGDIFDCTAILRMIDAGYGTSSSNPLYLGDCRYIP